MRRDSELFGLRFVSLQLAGAYAKISEAEDYVWCREGNLIPRFPGGDFKMPPMLVNFNAAAAFRCVFEYTRK